MNWVYVEGKTFEGAVAWIKIMTSEIWDGKLSYNALASLIFYCECGFILDEWEIMHDTAIFAVPPEHIKSDVKLCTVPFVIPVAESHHRTLLALVDREYWGHDISVVDMTSVLFAMGMRQVLARFMRSNEAMHAVNPDCKDFPAGSFRLDIESVLPYYLMWDKIGIL